MKPNGLLITVLVLVLSAHHCNAKQLIDGIEVLTTLDELVDPAHTMVLVIDMQNESLLDCGHYYADVPGWKRENPVPEEPKISKHFEETHDIARLAKFLDAARSTGVGVAYIEIIFLGGLDHSGIPLFHRNQVKPPSDTGRWWSLTIDPLAPKEGETIFYKPTGDSFQETNLDAFLRARSIKSVILVGTATNGCVMGTTWGAELHGYYPVIVRDCVNYGTEEQRKNAQFGAPKEDPPDNHPGAYYERCLSFMDSRYPVYESDEILSAWKELKQPDPEE